MIVFLTGAHATDKKYIKSELFHQLNYKKLIYKDYEISYEDIIEQENSKSNFIIKNKNNEIVYKLTNDPDDQDINFISDEDRVNITSLILERKEYLISHDFIRCHMQDSSDNPDYWKSFAKDEDELRRLTLVSNNFTNFRPNYLWPLGFKDYPGKGDIMLEIIHERHQKRLIKYIQDMKVGEEIFMNAPLKTGTDLFVRAVIDSHKKAPEIYQIYNMSVSEYVINQLIKSVGQENVLVINLTRNPTCSYLFDFDIENDESDTNSATDKLFTDKTFHYKLTGKSIYSLFNQCVLKNNPNVLTIKYEELLKHKFVNILGKKIIFNKIESKNDLISKYEHEKILPILKSRKYLEKVSLITLYNKLFSNIHQNLNKNFFTEKAKEYYYNNVFEELEYKPLSFFDICSLRKK